MNSIISRFVKTANVLRPWKLCPSSIAFVRNYFDDISDSGKARENTHFREIQFEKFQHMIWKNIAKNREERRKEKDLLVELKQRVAIKFILKRKPNKGVPRMNYF